MKKILMMAAALMVFGYCANANAAQDLPLVGEYTNDAGFVVIAQAPKSQGANYDIAIEDKSGKCLIEIKAATNKVTEQDQDTGKVFHPNTIATVKDAKFPNFSLWPEDQTIRIADDALPFDQLDPSCSVFKGNLVFTRK